MKDNVNNYSAHITSELETPSYHYIDTISGCNQAILSYRSRYLYILIPNSYIEEFEKESGVSLDDYLEHIKVFGVVTTVMKSDLDIKYSWINMVANVNTSTIFRLDISDYENSKRLRYFAFCLIRHLYYYQTTIVEYLKYVNNYSDEVDKIHLLSECVARFCGGYTYLMNGINATTSVNEINQFLKINNNSNLIAFSANYRRNNLSVVESIAKNKEAYYIWDRILNNTDPSNYKYVLLPNHQCFNVLKKNNDHIILNSYTHFIIILPDSEYNIIKDCINKPTKNYLYQENLYFYSASYPKKKENFVCYNINNLPHIIKGDNINISKYNKFQNMVNIRSRHPSHDIFRRKLYSDKKVLIRMGSTTKVEKEYDLEINTIDSIKISSNKLLMKNKFDEHGVITTDWSSNIDKYLENSKNPYPIIVKNIYGSRGTGNHKIDDADELTVFLSSHKKNIKSYIFEEFFNSAKEYRIHVSTEGPFLMWRKLRRTDTPADQRWFFNNHNCNWVGIDNLLFDSPTNIKDIQNECIKALTSVGLTIGACDVRVQSNRNSNGSYRKAPVFKIIEINSAPSMGEITGQTYINEFKKIINKEKYDV